MKDYYAILGLDVEASADSIKAAYRRLARENHPDRVGHLGADATAEAQNKMAELNEAYAVLSDSKQRREYDSKWRATFSHRPEDLDAAVEAIKQEQQKSADIQTVRARARQKTEALVNMVRGFAHQVQKDLLTNAGEFNWKDVKVEGFEWGMEASFLMAKYVVAMRAFPTGDRAAAQKFTNYASFAYSAHQSQLKANYFLFVMAFQRMADSESVMAECKRFIQTEAPKTVLGTQSLILLLDAGQGRSVLCGIEPTEKRFRQVLHNVRTRRK